MIWLTDVPSLHEAGRDADIDSDININILNSNDKRKSNSDIGEIHVSSF